MGLGRPCVLLALSVASARVSDHAFVSTPRSANRTGGSPASGSPTRISVPYAHRGMRRRSVRRRFTSPYFS